MCTQEINVNYHYYHFIISLSLSLSLLLSLSLSLLFLFYIVIFIFINIVVALNNNDIFFTVCELLNSTTGMMPKCKIDCCDGDFCNTDNAAVRISGLVTSFVVILLTLFLNVFPGA